MGYSSTEELMQHLIKNGIYIDGDEQKRQLINNGYFHGYKGYRFFNTSNNKIPFTEYKEVNATIEFDSQLKALFYGKIMYIETAVKSISLECILKKADSENIQNMYENVISGYHSCPEKSTLQARKKAQSEKLKLQVNIQNYLSRAYKEDNPKITHFYNNLCYNDVPIWALFEILTLGDFGFLLSCLTFDAREFISKTIGLDDKSIDTNRELIYKYIYTLKDLRNAIAHNAVVFDTRFRKIYPTPAMKSYLMKKLSLPYVNFKTIGDYLFLVCYYLKILGSDKSDILSFINDFELITERYKQSVNLQVYSIVIHKDLPKRIETVKQYFNINKSEEN